MSKSIPTIKKYMTTTPLTIGSDQPIAKATAIMHEHHVRHLPVLDGGKLVGILSERDVRLAESLVGAEDAKLIVDDVMVSEPYVVSPDAYLDEVAATMAEHKYGSAVVGDHGKVVGIFTVVDACMALAELLSTRLRK